MRKIKAFLFVTLNGCYKGMDEDTSWHHHDEEGSQFSVNQLASNNILLFGRKTYEMMNSFWPTPMAANLFPEVAKGMNNAEKIVVSHTLKNPTWQNTTCINTDMIDYLTKFKKTKGHSITILGSGEIVRQLTNVGLIDEYSLLIDPVIIANGIPLFDDLLEDVSLTLTESKVFQSGAILATYKPNL